LPSHVVILTEINYVYVLHAVVVANVYNEAKRSFNGIISV